MCRGVPFRARLCRGTVRTITIFAAFARATAAVVRARNTSMTCGRQGILKTARELGSVACSLVGVRFAEDFTLEGAGLSGEA